MSKRKSANLMKNVDMVFEDEMEDDQAGSVASTSDSIKYSVSGRASSGRLKKQKTIYDPSSGPVHKRKKEALEALGAVNKSNEGKSKPKLEVKPTIPVEEKIKPTKSKPVLELQSRPDLKKVLTVPSAKLPSKRIQERRPLQNNDYKETSTLKKSEKADPQFLLKRLDSISGNSSEDHALHSITRANVLPDVKQWSCQDLFHHFTSALNFSKQDCARIFIEEEIDGEALFLLKRSDIVTEKFSKLKLGTALKIWTNIQKIQTKSMDPSQSWK